jgi:hypothetical protein
MRDVRKSANNENRNACNFKKNANSATRKNCVSKLKKRE